MKLLSITTIATATVLASSSAFAAVPTLNSIQKEWAQCQYQVTDSDEQEKCFQVTIMHTSQALYANPDNPELTVWLAINKASLAGAKGGLGALSLVKESKALLEKVIDSAQKTLDGSAYTSLGSLYYKVPGWPIGFGDDEVAEKMLKKALEINPDGIDPNYFYGDFLAEEGRRSEAIKYLTKAQQAAPRPDRPIADQGRQQEITQRLESLTK